MQNIIQRWEDSARQTGRTYKLILGLPNDGNCVIFIRSSYLTNDWKRDILKIRGEFYPINRIRFAYATSFEDAQTRIKGMRLPVFIDNDVLYLWNLQEIKKLNQNYDMKWNPPHVTRPW